MCIINLDDDTADLWSETKRRARKSHKCSSCGGPIITGSHYIVHYSRYDGQENDRAKMCTACECIREEFFNSHGALTPPSTLRKTLEECIAEGDEDSEKKWKPMLAEMDERRALAGGPKDGGA